MRTKIIAWWKWVGRDGWELMEVESTDYAGLMPTPMRPYFWETWRNVQTGEMRTIPIT